MTSPTSAQKPHNLVRVVEGLVDNWHNYADYAGAIMLAASSVVGSFTQLDIPPFREMQTSDAAVWSLFLLLLGAVAMLSGLIRKARISPSYSELLKLRDKADSTAKDRADALESIVRSTVVDLCKSLGLYIQTCRASVYYLSHNNEFVLLSRVSLSPTLREVGRPSYPKEQGVIGSAWERGTASLSRLPEDRQDWELQMVKQGLSSKAAKSLRMQSRSIVGRRIDHDGVTENQPVGVIVIESLSPLGVGPTLVDKIDGDPHWAVLRSTMQAASSHFPAIAGALVKQRRGAEPHQRPQARARANN